ncbi:putative leader peptide [Streptomyces sp. NPDC055681]
MYPGVLLTARRHVDLARLAASLCKPSVDRAAAVRTSHTGV